MTNRLIIVGSPRTDGRCAALSDLLFESCIAEFPEDEVALVPVSTLDVAGCVGCDGCRRLAGGGEVGLQGRGPEEGAPDEGGGEGDAPDRRCVIEDDMAEVYPLIDAADELTLVSPVYFAGPPSQLKALLDRFQPYYWERVAGGGASNGAAPRPATLHVVGEGGDPHGFEPLIGVVRSACGAAGFRLERVLDWVGRIDERGEIVADAELRELGEPSVQAKSQANPQADVREQARPNPQAKGGQRPQAKPARQPGPPKKGQPKPRLDLSGPADKRKGSGKGARKGRRRG